MNGTSDSPDSPASADNTYHSSIPPAATPVNTHRETHLAYYSPTPPRSRLYQPTLHTAPTDANPELYEIIDLTEGDAYIASLRLFLKTMLSTICYRKQTLLSQHKCETYPTAA